MFNNITGVTQESLGDFNDILYMTHLIITFILWFIFIVLFFFNIMHTNNVWDDQKQIYYNFFYT